MTEEVDLTVEPIEGVKNDSLNLKEVSEMDKFKLAKSILLASLTLYICIIVLFAFSAPLGIQDPMKEVWSFSSQGLFGIINLIIGFYFGGKIAATRD
jgi:hypothetical protein